jgi:mutator protein MutT
MSLSGNTIAVVAGLILQNHQILLCQRAATDQHPLKWEFPGGKKRPDESLENALARELTEELNIQLVSQRHLLTGLYQYEGRPLIELHFFWAEAHLDKMRNNVFATVQWVPVNSVAEYDLLAADKRYWPALKKKLDVLVFDN